MRFKSCSECKFYSVVPDSPNLYECTYSAETDEDIDYFEEYCCDIM